MSPGMDSGFCQIPPIYFVHGKLYSGRITGHSSLCGKFDVPLQSPHRGLLSDEFLLTIGDKARCYRRILTSIGNLSDRMAITAKSETAFTAKFCLKSGTRGRTLSSQFPVL